MKRKLSKGALTVISCLTVFFSLHGFQSSLPKAPFKRLSTFIATFSRVLHNKTISYKLYAKEPHESTKKYRYIQQTHLTCIRFVFLDFFGLLVLFVFLMLFFFFLLLSTSFSIAFLHQQKTRAVLTPY